jgi:hypothetical protein
MAEKDFTRTSSITTKPIDAMRIAAPEYAGSYDIQGMATISIKRGDATNYANMRAAQLSALLNTICGEGGDEFRRHDSITQDNYLWATRCLAEEVGHLIEIVARDARAQANAAQI